MVRVRSVHKLYVLPLIAVTLTTGLLGCSPPPGSDEKENPFQAKDLPEDKSKKNNTESVCGEHKCGGGIE